MSFRQVGLLFLLVFSLVKAVSLAPTIRNLQARYDAQQDAIFVTWNGPPGSRSDLQYQLQYRIVNREAPDNELHYKRVQVTEARLDLPDLQNGDEVEVDVKSELDGGARGQHLSISIVKQSQNSGQQQSQNAPRQPTADSDEEDQNQQEQQEELQPPLNFEATILDPNSVKLEWRPNTARAANEVFYVVNIKQLSTNSPGATQDNILRQQLKVDGHEFTLNNLVPGEKYEVTIRTATSAEHTSSTAAIVEITMPNDNDFFEVGNLLIASKFQADGSGSVNLTWEVPAEMRPKIESYNIQYTSAQESNWRQLTFPGDNPSTILHDLKSDTEYILKIKTKMRSGVETESGEFRFKTPKVNPNPISKVDVIYSSETNDVRVQWILQDFVEKSQVIGYDVYISEFKDVPDTQWRYIRVDSAETSTNIDRLPTSTTYFVKIYVRLRDGQLLKSSILYKFTTLNEYPKATQLYPRSVEIHGPKTFSYRNLSPSESEIRWQFTPEIAQSTQEARIYYTTDTEEENLNSSVWLQKDIEIDQRQAEQVLKLDGLQPDSVYFIKAVPKVDGQLKVDLAESFSIKTAPAEQQQEQQEQQKHRKHRRSLHHHNRNSHRHHHRRHILVQPAQSHFQLTACNPHKQERQCQSGHHCVKINHREGWCMDQFFIEQIVKESKRHQSVHGVNV